MDSSRRSSIAFGLVLVLLGVWFLAIQMVPALQTWLAPETTWPLIVIGIGAAFLLFAILGGIPGLAVPACIIGGIGSILYWQNATNRWESWAFIWTLIPGFAGLGTVLMGLLGEKRGESIRGGLWLMAISLVMFAIFSSFLGGVNLLGPYWPILLIALGVVLFVRSFARPH